MKKSGALFAALMLFAVVSKTHGLTFTATRPGDNKGETLKAEATFTVSNLDLIVELSNTATFDANDAADVLAAVFFNIAGDPKLTPISAGLEPGSSVIAKPLPLGFDGDVGNEWAYRNDLSRAPAGADEGISTVNLKWFGNKKYLFPGENFDKDRTPGGIDFGITTVNDQPRNDKGNIKHQPLIDNSVVFVMAGLPAGFDLSKDISAVTFQYGTNLKQPEITGGLAIIPEPSTLTLIAAGLAGGLALIRRKTVRR